MNKENQKVQEQKISGVTKAGLIIQIVVAASTILGCFIAILVLSLYRGFIIRSAGSEMTAEQIENLQMGLRVAVIILTVVVIPVEITNLVLSSLALKKETKNLVLVSGIMGIIFGDLLGGILTLVGANEK